MDCHGELGRESTPKRAAPSEAEPCSSFSSSSTPPPPPPCSSSSSLTETETIPSKMFKCKVCWPEFGKSTALCDHCSRQAKRARKANGYEEQPQPPRRRVLWLGRRHPCLYCEKSFDSGQALGGHMRKHRPLNRTAGRVVEGNARVTDHTNMAINGGVVAVAEVQNHMHLTSQRVHVVVDVRQERFGPAPREEDGIRVVMHSEAKTDGSVGLLDMREMCVSSPAIDEHGGRSGLHEGAGARGLRDIDLNLPPPDQEEEDEA